MKIYYICLYTLLLSVLIELVFQHLKLKVASEECISIKDRNTADDLKSWLECLSVSWYDRGQWVVRPAKPSEHGTDD